MIYSVVAIQLHIIVIHVCDIAKKRKAREWLTCQNPKLVISINSIIGWEQNYPGCFQRHDIDLFRQSFVMGPRMLCT